MMRSRPAPLLASALAAALLVGGGCKDEPSPENDRTLAKLKAESERQAEGQEPPPAGFPGRPMTPGAYNKAMDDALAKIAADAKQKPPGESGQKLALPEPNATVHVGTTAVKLLALSGSHTETGGKLSVSSEDLFLRTQLVAQNVGQKPAKLDFAYARVVDGKGGEHPLARDVQHLAGSRELAVTLAPDERKEFILYFEVPREGPGKGWTLVLPAAVGGEQDVSIPLG